MKILRNITLGLSALVLLGLGAIYATGNGLLLTMGWTVAFGGGNYHGLDYPVFHMDIRENAKLRVQTFLAQQD